MIVFTAHEPAVPKPDALDRAESIVFVREGFSVWAAVFGPLWCLVNGLWIVLAGLLAITLGLTALVGLLTSAPAAGTVVSAALNLVFGFEANNLKRWTLSRKGYRTVGVVAGANAEAHGVADRLTLAEADWWDGVDAARFDLVVSNPPYIAADEMAGLAPEVRNHDPQLALTPGGDGLAAYRAILGGLNGRLTPRGRVMVEIGPTQGKAVAGFFVAAGLEGVTILHDLDGRERVVTGIAPA